jgi:hypothetical protein
MRLRSKAPWLAGGLFLLVAAAMAACDAADAEPRLTSTFESPEALARAVLEAVSNEDVGTLKSLPLTKDEFRLYVWPKLPASRPERGLPLEYAWGELNQKSRNAIATNYALYKGRRLELVSIRFKDGKTDYESFIVHRKSLLRVRDPESGAEQNLELFGSVMEWKGKYKLFSYVTD